MGQRQSLDARATGLMVLLCAIWSFQQIAIKAAAPDMAPILQIGIRSGLAAVLVCIMLHWRGTGILAGNGAWRPGLLAGFLFALEYLLVGEGLRYTSASHMVVFLYTAPCFAALGLHWRLPEERLRPLQWAGMALAFAGIALAFHDRSPDAGNTTGAMLFGDLLGLLAGMSWGATTIVVRCTRLAVLPAAQTVLYQLAGACVMLLAATVLLGQSSFTLTPTVLASLAFQTFIMSFASLLAWFWLLRNYLASRLGVLSFLTPVFGIAFGVALLHETVEESFLAGAALVMAGIVLVTGYGWISALFGAEGRQAARDARP